MLIDHVKDYSLCEVSNIDKYAVNYNGKIEAGRNLWTMRYEVDGYHNIG